MSYREENGQVVLTMSRDDYEIILLSLGTFSGLRGSSIGPMLALMNRLNEGNPNYRPYALTTSPPSVGRDPINTRSGDGS